MTIVSIQDLSHEYVTYQKTEGFIGSLMDFIHRKVERKAALRNLHLTIREGEMVGLLGPNGAGKTTLMKILAGLIHPRRGAIEVMGYQPYKKPRQYLRRIGLVLGQKSQLMWDLPASDTFALLKEVYKVSDHDYHGRLTFLLGTLGVSERLHTPVRKLSLGERMKFELIAALLHQPALLLLDEPTIGLDIASQRAIHAFLRDVNKRFQTTIIMTSHYARDIEALADRLVILRQGHVQYDGTLKNLLAFHHDMKILRVEARENLSGHPLGFRSVADHIWECEVPADELSQALLEIAGGITIQNITTQDKPLEDVLYDLFSQAADREV